MDEWIKYLVMPSNLITLLIILAAALFYFKKHRAFRITLGLSIGIYLLLGFGPVAHFLLGHLEYRYAAYEKCESEICDIDTIVLLTGDGETKPGVPVTSHVNHSSLFRIVEAIRILQLHPQARIYISGSSDVTVLIKQVLLSANIAESSIVLDRHADSTYESAVSLHSELQNDQFVLVTSAGHMPRAMAVFRTQQMHPVAAPTEFLSQRNILAAQYLPTARHLLYSELAIHEYLAIAWYRLTGKIDPGRFPQA